MEKNVIVSVVGLQINGSDQEPDLMEMMTEGTYKKRGGVHYISYKESETTGMEGTTTTIKASRDELTLIRNGVVNSQFIFRQGMQHLSHYDAGYGAITVDITAKNVEIDFGDHVGNIRLGYEILVNDGDRMYNDVIMEIRDSLAQQTQSV